MISFLLYKLGELLACSMPLTWAYAVAVVFSDLRFFVAGQDRKLVMANLRVIFPEKSVAELREIRRCMFNNFAKYLVDFFRSPCNKSNYYTKFTRVEGFEYFDQALAKGKGVVVLTAHIGNWEMGGQVIGRNGYDFWVVALPHVNKYVNRFFDGRRETGGMKVIPFGKAARLCLQLLKQNKLIGLVGDRDFSNERGIIVDFFGKPTYLPKGPAALAIATGAPIVAGFMIRNPDDTFTLKIQQPIEPAPGQKASNEGDIRELIGRYKTVIADFIRKYPEQWFMFRQFWTE
jgi:lauroyl/myristoyl acyltransferase